MPVGPKRDRTLYGIGKKRGHLHRYTWVRWGVGIVFTIAVAALPLLDVLRFDMWAGRHVVLGEQVGLVQAAKAFVFPFLALNVGIIVASRFLGRWLCGFVCPVGNLNRLAEWIRWRFKSLRARVAAGSLLTLVNFVMAAITFSFWVDWRVFTEGSPRAVAFASIFLFGMTAAFTGLVVWVGMRFCRGFCPSGVYFALLGPDTRTGVEFAHPEACTECKACEAVCPVDLKPTEMATGEMRAGIGFYPDGMTNYANCLRCGDCVVACEATTARNEAPVPLRMGVLPVPDDDADGAAAPAGPAEPGRAGGGDAERPAARATSEAAP